MLDERKIFETVLLIKKSDQPICNVKSLVADFFVAFTIIHFDVSSYRYGCYQIDYLSCLPTPSLFFLLSLTP